MELRKKPKLSQKRRRQITDLWPRINAGEITDIGQAMAAIPISEGDPEYVVVRAVLSLFLERGPTLLGTFDIYTEMAYLFAEVILESTPPAVVSLMHIAAIPSHFNLSLLAHLVDRSPEEIKPYFEQLTQSHVVKPNGGSGYWFPPTFRDCLLLHWFSPENQARYCHIEQRLQLWQQANPKIH